jgi:Mg2+/Co2+ transporter CorB
MMAVNRYRLQHLVQRGHRGARLASQLLLKTDKLLGVILLGNNLLNAAAAGLVTMIALRYFGSNEYAFSIATAVVTFLILVFSEITPKVLGATYSDKLVLFVSYLLTPLLKLLSPIIWFINLFVNAILWVLRLKPNAAESSHKLSPEELRSLVLEASHFIPPKHRSILNNLFDLEKVTVDDVMIPRNQIEAIDINTPEDQLREQLATSYHTRLPVYKDQLDNVLGIAHIRQVLSLLQNEELNAQRLEQTLRKPYFIPAGTLLFPQLQQFQENQHRIGLVVDEYGELMGLVTLEDILEEIIGEFTTHSPWHADKYEQQPDGSVLVQGTSLLRNLNRKLGTQFPLDGPKTLNGLILEHFQDIPEAGTSFKIGEHALEIMQTQDRVVKVVRLIPAEKIIT